MCNMYKKLIIKFMFVFLFLSIIIVSLSAFFYFFHPLYKSAEYWIPEMYMIKNIRAQEIKGNKIIIISGSNSLFGVSSELLGKKMNMPVLNLAVHAGLPIEFLAKKIEIYAVSGDIVVMPLEFGYYSRKETPSGWEVSQFSTWGSNDRAIFSKSKQYEIAKKALMTYALRFMYVFKPLPIREVNEFVKDKNYSKILTKNGYRPEYSNKYGEFMVDSSFFYAKGLNNGSSYIDSEFSDFFITSMSSLREKLHNKGILLLVTLPVSIDNEKFTMKNKYNFDQIMKIFEFLEKNDIEFFGNPYKYNLEKEYFWDSLYHLNAKGAILRTLYLADDLKYFLDKREIDIEKPSQEYCVQRDKEAQYLLEEYRKLGYVSE